VVVVVLIPIAFFVPAVFVFIPPFLVLAPAALACVVQFAALVIGPPTVAPVSSDGLMKFVFVVNDPTLAVLYGFGPQRCWTCEK
jgi:pilus assembly protein TadC